MDIISKIFKNKGALFYAFCGMLIGFLVFIYPAVIFYSVIIIFVTHFIYNRAEDHEKSFLLRIFFYGLTLRLVFAAVTHILSVYYGFGPRCPPFLDLHGGAIIGDDIGIHQRAWALARLVNGLPLSQSHIKYLLGFSGYGWGLYVYFLSFLYYLFGTVPFLGKCLNSLFGVLIIVVVYFIAKESYDIKVAKLAVVLTVFFPTLFLWSVTNLKDTVLIFLLTLFLYSCIIFFKKKTLRGLFLSLALLFLISSYRLVVVFMLIFSLLISLIIRVKWNYKKVIFSVIISVFLLNGYLTCNSCKTHASSILKKTGIGDLIKIQRGHVDVGGAFNKIYPERFYNQSNPEPINPGELVISLFRGAFSVMFKPLPWRIDNIDKFFYYPVAAVWGLLFPSFVIGVIVTVRYYFRKNIMLLSVFIIIFVLLSLTQGNIGTMIRLRDMITPLYMIFSSFGFVRLLSIRQLKAD